MFDVALKSAGAQVVLATSSDGNHPPENIIDGYGFIIFYNKHIVSYSVYQWNNV